MGQAVAGLRGTGNFGTDERPKNFREMILFLNPNGTAPLFALTSKAKKKTTDDPEFAWWDESNTIYRLQVNGALASTDTLVAVDSTDPTASNQSLAYGTASHLKQGDLLMVEPSSDVASFTPEVIEVVSVASDTNFTVRRGASGTTPATIADNAFLLLIGSAYAEGSGAPKAVSRNPVKYSNFTQIFKDTYELTGTVDETNLRTGQAWSNDKKRKMFDHALKIEMAMLFGQKAEATGDNGKPQRYMGGLRQQIPSVNTTVFSSAVTISSFLDAVYPVFNWESGAGDDRIAFAGNVALNELNKVIKGDASSRVTWGGIITQYGMNFREFVMPQGRLLIRTHPLLNRHPTIYGKSLWIVDFSSINYVCMKNRDTKVRDDVQNKDEDVRRGFVQTECSLMVDRGGLTSAYLGNISAT
jgi:hypothetical protein